LVWVIVNALALGAATWLLSGIRLTADTEGQQLVSLVLVAIVFGVVNAVIGPVVKLLSLPFIILTLGLLIFVINALLLMLTGWLAGQLGIGFEVDGFLPALGGALVITVVSWVLGLVFRDSR
jgi:putative membrane protein